MSRVDAAFLAVHKARQQGHEPRGSVMASDAFFPFPDGVEEAAAAGVTATRPATRPDAAPNIDALPRANVSISDQATMAPAVAVKVLRKRFLFGDQVEEFTITF